MTAEAATQTAEKAATEAASVTEGRKKAAQSSRVVRKLKQIPDLLGDAAASPSEIEADARQDTEARQEPEARREPEARQEPEETHETEERAEVAGAAAEPTPAPAGGARTAGRQRTTRRRQKKTEAVPVDLPAGDPGYKLSVTVPTALDVSLTRLLAGQRWGSGHKVGKIEALRVLIVSAYNLIDWDSIEWTTPEDAASQISAQLGGE